MSRSPVVYECEQGARMRASITYVDETQATRPLADPTTATVRVLAPGTTTPTEHTPTKTDPDVVGEYHYDLDASAPGDWVLKAYGAGAVVAASPVVIVRVRGSALD